MTLIYSTPIFCGNADAICNHSQKAIQYAYYEHWIKISYAVFWTPANANGLAVILFRGCESSVFKSNLPFTFCVNLTVNPNLPVCVCVCRACVCVCSRYCRRTRLLRRYASTAAFRKQYRFSIKHSVWLRLISRNSETLFCENHANIDRPNIARVSIEPISGSRMYRTTPNLISHTSVRSDIFQQHIN